MSALLELISFPRSLALHGISLSLSLSSQIAPFSLRLLSAHIYQSLLSINLIRVETFLLLRPPPFEREQKSALMPTNGGDQLPKEARGDSERWETGVESSRGWLWTAMTVGLTDRCW